MAAPQRVMYSSPMYAPMYGQAVGQPLVVMPPGTMPAQVPVYYGGYPTGGFYLIAAQWSKILFFEQL